MNVALVNILIPILISILMLSNIIILNARKCLDLGYHDSQGPLMPNMTVYWIASSTD